MEDVGKCNHSPSETDDGPEYKKVRQHTSPVAVKTSVHGQMTPGAKCRVAAKVR